MSDQNDINDDGDDLFASRTKIRFDESVEDLDAATRSRLTQSRHDSQSTNSGIENSDRRFLGKGRSHHKSGYTFANCPHFLPLAQFPHLCPRNPVFCRLGVEFFPLHLAGNF